MLSELHKAMDELPDLLADRGKWDSLIVNLRKPWTYRVYSRLKSGMRVCLHRFEVCHKHEAFKHPHPWPGAFIVLDGAYKMEVGYSPDRVSKPSEVTTLILRKWSEYEIVSPLTWHAVIPLETTHTVMVNDESWPPEVAHKEVRTTKGKDLDRMPENELIAHLAKFQALVREYGEGVVKGS